MTLQNIISNLLLYNKLSDLSNLHISQPEALFINTSAKDSKANDLIKIPV